MLELGFPRDHPVVLPAPGAHASPPGSYPRQLGQVEISPFKPARANQELARPAVPTRRAASLGSRREKGGRLSLLSGVPAAAQPPPGDRPSCPVTTETPWSAPCTASPSGAGAPTRTCPSISPPLVSASGSGCQMDCFLARKASAHMAGRF